MLSAEELEDLIEKITIKITQANRLGELDILLKQWGISDFINPSTNYLTNKRGKIVVIGETAVKETKLIGVIKELGLDPDRFEFCLDFNKAKSYPYKKFHFNQNYRLVLFGPVPHSSTGKHFLGSVISEMQLSPEYPRVEVLRANHELKITKSNFAEMLNLLIAENYI